MDPYQQYLANEQAKKAAMTQATTGAGAAGLGASTLAGFNWPGLVRSAAPNVMGPLGVLAGMLMPGRLNNPQANPDWREQPRQGPRSNPGFGYSTQDSPRKAGLLNMSPTHQDTPLMVEEGRRWDTPLQQEEDTSIVGQMRRNAGYGHR